MPALTKPYLDELGQPRLRESITAFLDLLGFSHSVVSAAEAIAAVLGQHFPIS